MANPSFVQSAYKRRGEEEIRRVNFRNTNFKYVTLLIACLVVFGCEYCFDNPSALQSEIQHNYEKGTEGEIMGEAQFNLLYSLYSFPNVVIPLIGGILIDKIGARIVLIITAALCVMGQAVFGLGGFVNAFSIMLVGRAIFGLGGEVLHAAQNTIMSSWFKASQLSMALGICISFPKLGSALNAYVSPLVAKAASSEGEWLNVALPIMIGFCIMVFSLIMAVVLSIIDRRTELQQTVAHESTLLANPPAMRTKSKSKSKSRINQSSRSKLSEHSVHLIEQSQVDENEPQGVEGGEHLNLKDIGKLPISFWLLIVVAMLSEALFIPFLDNGNKYYQSVFTGIENAEEAGIYLILPYVVSSLCVPFMGYAVDKVGRRSNVLIISCAFFVLTYAFMLLVETSVTLRESELVRWIPTLLLGVCVSIFCTVIVPTIPMLVQPKLLGTGFGLMEMIQNLGLATFPIISGSIRQTRKTPLAGFHRQTLFFFVVSCLCLSVAIFLKTADIFKGEKLAQKNFRKTYIKRVLKQDD